jgi:RimJ/RimL family protein N-acetyltransferase
MKHQDVGDLKEIVSHPSVARITTAIGTSESSVRSYIDQQISLPPFEKGKYVDLLIERKEDRKVIGLVGLMCEDHQQGLMGWALGVDHRGKGYATEAARALIQFAFSELDLHRIYAQTSLVNTASWKVMEHIGMRKEAHFREAELRDGKWIDTLIYAILFDEWVAQSEARSSG